MSRLQYSKKQIAKTVLTATRFLRDNSTVKNFLYAGGWYLVMGETGSGKSRLIVDSGLQIQKQFRGRHDGAR